MTGFYFSRVSSMFRPEWVVADPHKDPGCCRKTFPSLCVGRCCELCWAGSCCILKLLKTPVILSLFLTTSGRERAENGRGRVSVWWEELPHTSWCWSSLRGAGHQGRDPAEWQAPHFGPIKWGVCWCDQAAVFHILSREIIGYICNIQDSMNLRQGTGPLSSKQLSFCAETLSWKYWAGRVEVMGAVIVTASCQSDIISICMLPCCLHIIIPGSSVLFCLQTKYNYGNFAKGQVRPVIAQSRVTSRDSQHLTLSGEENSCPITEQCLSGAGVGGMSSYLHRARSRRRYRRGKS